ncbi:hypothetical protein BS78_04G326700 [Paspalum vaginatum]|nr:hypothetical protein BS78_04G326700 [Paspalum vaginatum]
MEVHFGLYFLLTVSAPHGNMLWTTDHAPPTKSILIPSVTPLPPNPTSLSLSLSLTHAMRRMLFRHLFPWLLLLLLMSHLPTSTLGSRRLRGGGAESTELRRLEHELPPTKSPSQEVGGDDDDAAADSKYTVSRRMVPQGPNPLHNR